MAGVARSMFNPAVLNIPTYYLRGNDGTQVTFPTFDGSKLVSGEINNFSSVEECLLFRSKSETYQISHEHEDGCNSTSPGKLIILWFNSIV